MSTRYAPSAALAASLGLAFAASAQADTLRLDVGKPLARFDRLQAGTHRYLRYTIGADGSRKAIDVWTRTVAFTPPAAGQPAGLHIVQRWDEVEGKVVLIQDSWFERGTFRPVTHIRHLERDGKISIGGYRFGETQVTGMADLAENSRKDFVMPLPQPSYNFEYDMELLQALPMAAGRTFDIPFYDAGVDKPGRYNFVVAGSATVAGWDGRPVDCWLVTADYNTGKVQSRFWFVKSSQVLLREEAPQSDGAVLVKTLLPPESADEAKA